MSENILRISAFSSNGEGGNPAGVVIGEVMLDESSMRAIAREINYSETAFLCPRDDGWRIRYFSPEIEVPFCGHATIASGAALGRQFGTGVHKLYLNEGSIAVTSSESEGNFSATLKSPQTWSQPLEPALADAIMGCFGLSDQNLSPEMTPGLAFAGAKIAIIALRDRQTLKAMDYDFQALQRIVLKQDIVTVNLVYTESNKLYHSRNAFAYGGVVEDPATGAAAAALAGYLRDLSMLPEDGKLMVKQGDDMGQPSRLQVSVSNIVGDGVKVTGETHLIV